MKILGVPHSTYYSKINPKKSNREVENEKLKKAIKKVNADMDLPKLR